MTRNRPLAVLALRAPRCSVQNTSGPRCFCPWISRLFEEADHEVFVANPRKLRAIYQNDRKSDKLDAQILARLGRLDPNLLHPIQHQSEQAQIDLLQIKLRDNMVRQRVDII